MKTLNQWLNELLPFATVYLLYLLIRVVAKAGDSIISKVDDVQRELASIRESIQTISDRISPQ